MYVTVWYAGLDGIPSKLVIKLNYTEMHGQQNIKPYCVTVNWIDIVLQSLKLHRCLHQLFKNKTNSKSTENKPVPVILL
jgi:hypothetical protein